MSIYFVWRTVENTGKLQYQHAISPGLPATCPGRKVKVLEIGCGSGRWARSLFPEDGSDVPVSNDTWLPQMASVGLVYSVNIVITYGDHSPWGEGPGGVTPVLNKV